MNHSKSVQNCAAAVCTLFFFAKIREKKGAGIGTLYYLNGNTAYAASRKGS